MQRLSLRLVGVGLLLLGACTRANPDYCPPSAHCAASGSDGGAPSFDGGGVFVDGSLPPTETPDFAMPPPPPPPCGTDCANAGGCCLNGACVPSGVSCDAANVCLAGTCQHCGDPGETCCAANACNANGCCGADGTCVSVGADCGGGLGQCDNRSCGGCGAAGESCCPQQNLPNICSAPGTACVGNHGDGTCRTCGQPGDPCCAIHACDNGGCCVFGNCVSPGASCGGPGEQCGGGHCSGPQGACGAVGEPCCGKDACTAERTRCIMGMCEACGGNGQRCCIDPQSQMPGWCGAPFTSQDVNGVCYCQS